MQWIIDGHNLIPHVPGLSLSDPDDEDALIFWLQEYTRKTSDTIELFFDKAAIGQKSPVKHGRIIVNYVPASTIADQAIISRLQKLAARAANYTVVSSDHFVQTNARASRAKIMESSTFVDRVTHTLKSNNPASPDTSHQLKDEEIQWWLDFFNHRG
jgi:predicted RNA-binding protein with PIN domain